MASPRRLVDREEAALLARLARLVPREGLAQVEVEAEDGEMQAGTRPSRVVKDRAGRKYLFKAAEDAHIAAELVALEVRQLGPRPTVAAVRRRMDLPGVGEVVGLFQPIVDNDGAGLNLDPLTWNELQVEVLLREHPWEWLLANLDTHADQYILVGPHKHPLNIDWDHSLVDLHVTELTRFNRRGLTIAPIRNLLYERYARGEVRLDFYGLRREVERVQRLDEGAVVAALERYAQALGLEDAARTEIVAAVLRRKRTLKSAFEQFLAGLRRERAEARYGTTGTAPKLRRAVTSARDAWQRVLITVIHAKVLRQGFKLYKAALASRERLRGTSGRD